MRNIIFFTVFTVCGLMLSAQTFVSTTPSNKNVIVEQFLDRGARGMETNINLLMSDNPNRVFGIDIHDNRYIPNIKKLEDFTCKDGLAFFDYFNPYFDLSQTTRNGMINRGNVENYQFWNNSANAILSQPSCLNIAAKGNIDWDLRQLTLTVEVYYTDNSNTNENYLTVALLQNNLEKKDGVSFAGLPNGNRNHLRVLRDILSERWDDTIANTTQGSFFTKTYIYVIPDTIETALPIYAEAIHPKVLLEDLEIVLFVSESEKNIISGSKAEITHENMPEINLHIQLDRANDAMVKCGDDLPFFLMLKNGGSDTIHSIKYNLRQNNQTLRQNQIWNNRLIYPFTMDTIAINDILLKGEIESLISIEITQLNEIDTLIAIEKPFTRHLVEDAKGAMKLIIAPDQFASNIVFTIFDPNNNVILTNLPNKWNDLSNPGIKEYAYDFLPKTTGCYSFFISDNLNRGYGDGYFKLLAEDGTVLLYNDGKNCAASFSFFNVTEAYNSVAEFQEKMLSVYPNPVTGQLRVVSGDISDGGDIQIYDIVGKLVQRSPMSALSPETTIDISHLANGMYYLRVGEKTVKFVKE